MGLERNNWNEISSREIVMGIMKDIHISSGGTWWKGKLDNDHDTNIIVEPDQSHKNFLVNRRGQTNPDNLMYWEINVASSGGRRTLHFDWVGSLKNAEVTGIGVLVEDIGHDEWQTELHPLDLIVGSVTRSISKNGDWITELANSKGLTIGTDLRAYRYAAAGDDRGGFFLDGPPHDDETRPVMCSLDIPRRPNPTSVLRLENRIEFAHRASAEFVILGSTLGSTGAVLDVTCKAKVGLILGEAVAYWSTP